MPTDLQAQKREFPLEEHPEVQETFADSIANAVFDSGTMRLELAVTRFENARGGKELKGKRHVVSRLVLSTTATIELINQMQQMTGALAQAGIVRQNQPGGGAPSPKSKAS